MENQNPSERLLVSPGARHGAAGGGTLQGRPVRPAPGAHATLGPAKGGEAAQSRRAGPAPDPHATPGTGAPGSVSGAAETSPSGPRPIPWVTPLAEAAAAVFPRLDLTQDEARRLAQGARLPLPPWWRGGSQHSNRPGAVTPGDEPSGSVSHGAMDDRARGAAAPGPLGATLAAFDPDGTLVALVTAEHGQIRSLAVFAGPAPPSPRT
jgi:hypothetical protein